MMSSPKSTVSIQRPSAAAVALRLQALQMDAAMRDATPTGDTHSTPTTITPMVSLRTWTPAITLAAAGVPVYNNSMCCIYCRLHTA